MLLLIAIGIAFVYALIKPISDGLFDTSLWLAKILAPVDTIENKETKQFMKFSQAALMEGWLSNIPFLLTILAIATIVLGFIYSWWGGILMILILVIFGGTTKYLMTRTISYYLEFIYHKMVQRACDYKKYNDLERAGAADSYCRDLEEIITVYKSSTVKPPSPKQLKEMPYGDVYFLLLAK